MLLARRAGTSKGAVTAEVSIGSDQPSEPKETALGKASGVEAHIGVDVCPVDVFPCTVVRVCRQSADLFVCQQRAMVSLYIARKHILAAEGWLSVSPDLPLCHMGADI